MSELIDLEIGLDRVNKGIERYEERLKESKDQLYYLYKKKLELVDEIDSLKQSNLNLFAKQEKFNNE
jgi:hypothetical protein